MTLRRNALVVGGAGGIGAACCAALAADWTPIVVDRDADAAGRVAAETGGRAYRLDVGDVAAIESCIATIEHECGDIDGLVFAAGVIPPAQGPAQVDAPVWDAILDINARGAYAVSRLVGLRMASRERGSIVMIASLAGMMPTPHLAYGPSKAAMINLAGALAVYLGRQGVRVNAVSPGPVRTPVIEASYARGERDPAVMARQTALGRVISPGELAGPIAFLLSDAAAAITGTNLVVDAGASATLGWNLFGGVETVLAGLQPQR
ncbi:MULTISPECIES: SDR family oxidoreductase [unclassified Caballeronia]|uniref:SDR family NAD(P)-dependent oxidoreductase n=1 Tax=unclassified Caballeronia TaxID=2646786 RepID=UPI002862534C|nr:MULTISPECIES: SDR family oxidoreductase [unclassified Caballeronia]MDR5814133.1 SDR family oxidoreductase [Caballeronia sp. LZ033]MDR5878679.1 SDR family oxidoreductase [Caballeronia sp. LZ032]